MCRRQQTRPQVCRQIVGTFVHHDRHDRDGDETAKAPASRGVQSRDVVVIVVVVDLALLAYRLAGLPTLMARWLRLLSVTLTLAFVVS